MEENSSEKPLSAFILPKWNSQTVCMEASGYFQGFDKKQLMHFATKYEGFVHFLKPRGSYILKGIPVLDFYSPHKLPMEKIKEILYHIDFYPGKEIQVNSYYGFHQLGEVALKALSPVINDPETAVLSLHALADLLSYKLAHSTQSMFEDENGVVRIQTREWNFEEIFTQLFYPIWEYGKKDVFIQNAMVQLIGQLMECDTSGSHKSLFTIFLNAVNKQIGENEFDKIN